MQAGKTQIVAGGLLVACLMALPAWSAAESAPAAKAAESPTVAAPAAAVKDVAAIAKTNPAPAAPVVSAAVPPVSPAVAPAAAVVVVPVAVPTPAEEAAWKADRERLLKRIEIRLRNEMAGAIVPAKVAAELRLPYPVVVSDKTVAKALAEADTRLAQEVAEKCQAGTPAEVRARVEKAMGAQHKSGERIQVQWTAGIRRPAPLGRLGTVKPDRFEIDGAWILARDIDPVLWQKISPAAYQAAVDEAITRELRVQHSQRITMEDEMREDFTKKVMLENGYYPLRVPGKKQIKGWISGKDILDRELVRRKTALQPVLLAKLEKEIFTEAGYVQASGEWISSERIEWQQKAVAAAAAATEKKANEAGEAVGAPKTTTPDTAPKDGKATDGKKADDKAMAKKGDAATGAAAKPPMAAVVKAANGEKTELLK